MNRLQMAQHIYDEFCVKDAKWLAGLKVIGVSFGEYFTAHLHLENGRRVELTGKFAVDLKKAPV